MTNIKEALINFISTKLCYLAPLFVAIVLLISILIYTQFGYLFGHDIGVSIFSATNAYDSLYVWSVNDYTGIPNITLPIFDYLMSSLGYLTKIISGSNSAGFIASLYTQFLIGALGMFYLVYSFTKRFGKFKAYFVSTISAFIFTIPISAYGETSAAMAIPFFSLVTYLFIKNIEKYKRVNLILLSLSILTLGIVFSMGGPYFGVQSLLFISITFLCFIALSEKSLRLKYLKSFFVVIIGAILLNLSWILGPELFSNIYSNFLITTTSINFINFYAIKIIGIIFSFDFFPTDKIIGPILLSSFPIFIIALSSLFVRIEKYRVEYNYIISIFISFLFITFFGNTTAKPFGNVFTLIHSYIPLVSIFRGSFISIHYLSIFTFSFMFGVGVAIILYKNAKYKSLTLIFEILIAITIVVFLYESTYGLNSYLGYQSVYFHKIPNYVLNISDYINNKTGNFAVAILPSAPGWQTTSWYYGVNIYSSLIYKHPVFTGGESSDNEIIFPPSTSEYYNYVGSIINTENMSNESISNLLGIFGIRYIILEADILNNTKCNCGYYPFSLNKITKNLNFSKNVKLVYLDNSSIYENYRYVKLVYGSNVKNIGNSSVSKIFYEIGNFSFNIMNNSVYLSNMGNFYNNAYTISVNTISNFSKPNISFIENTPTKVTVYVNNATTPYYLVFRETYDPYWVALYSNGTEVSSSKHIAVNGFANAWYMNRTGNYTITLYYTPQTNTWITWDISFAVLFVIIGIGIYWYYVESKFRYVTKGKEE